MTKYFPHFYLIMVMCKQNQYCHYMPSPPLLSNQYKIEFYPTAALYIQIIFIWNIKQWIQTFLFNFLMVNEPLINFSVL